ncbi:hypothetical protein HLB44_16860 [Aquincola sp. S2]|uniref:Uncharacterized protein n=1 Tax=Pseudaquabacterium terrae TaxID=2732868 RepID=A0ABX2EJ95_9BURK|nr:hypothetical protein [Aquabacterium terrae]NRF68665.1 hypothetical protein [Aquabacterium terrae]
MTTFQRAALSLTLAAMLGAAWMLRHTVVVVPRDGGAIAYLQDRWTGRVDLVIGDQRHLIRGPNFFDQMDGKSSSGAPVVGEIREGYRFLGGDPADRSSWAKATAAERR